MFNGGEDFVIDGSLRLCLRVSMTCLNVRSCRRPHHRGWLLSPKKECSLWTLPPNKLVSHPLKHILRIWLVQVPLTAWNNFQGKCLQCRARFFESDFQDQRCPFLQPYPVDHVSLTLSCACSAWRRWLSSEPLELLGTESLRPIITTLSKGKMIIRQPWVLFIAISKQTFRPSSV